MNKEEELTSECERLREMYVAAHACHRDAVKAREECHAEMWDAKNALADSQAECERRTEEADAAKAMAAKHLAYCQDTTRRMQAAMDECERLRAALDGDRNVFGTVADGIAEMRISAALGKHKEADEDGYALGVSCSLAIDRIDAALAGTPAPRPPRDESGPQCPECCEPMQPTEAHRCHHCDVFTGDTQWLIDKARELEEAPAPPDHGASVDDLCDELGAMMRSWMEPHSDGSDRDFDAVHDIREAISRFRSPVTRSEPTRAEPWRCVGTTHRWAPGYRRCQCDEVMTDMDEPDPYEEDIPAEQATPAAEDQPQPACPPSLDWSGDPVSTTPGECGYVAERPRQGEPVCFREPCSRCGGAVSKDECGDLFCDCPDGPAPEAQRAQSEPTWLEPGDDALLDFMCDVQDYVEGNNCNLERTFRAFDPEPYVVAFRATPAPNIAAAIAELEAIVARRADPTSFHCARRALDHLQGGAK